MLGGGEERRKRREEKRERRGDCVKKWGKKRKRIANIAGSLPLPPALPLSPFLTFFLSVAVHKTSSSAIRATWPLGP